MLPLLLLLKGSRGIRVIARLVTLCRIPGGTLMVGLVFAMCAWVLGLVLPVTSVKTLWRAALYVLSFIAGVLLYSDPAIEHAFARDGLAALLLATLCFVIEQVLVARSALQAASPGLGRLDSWPRHNASSVLPIRLSSTSERRHSHISSSTCSCSRSLAISFSCTQICPVFCKAWPSSPALRSLWCCCMTVSSKDMSSCASSSG